MIVTTMTRTSADLWWWLHVVLFFTSVVFAVNNTDKRYVLTGPERVLVGTEERFCLHIQGVQSAGIVTLTLQADNQARVSLIRQRIDPQKDNYDDCILLTLSVPSHIKEGKTQLNLKVDWDDPSTNLTIDTTKEIDVSYGNTLLQQIQTDKSWYTPGQLVRFRTLTCNHLSQLANTTLKRIWIVDPRNITVAEWKNVTSNMGVPHLEWPLSWQPVEGVWKINVDNGLAFTGKEFLVREFVHQRFEVTVTGPDLVTPWAETFEFSICAKYPSGQPVRGDVEGMVQLKRLRFWLRLIFVDGKPTNFAGETDKITGCRNFTFPVSELGIDGEALSQFVEITGQVTEKGTGIKLNSTIKVAVRMETKPDLVDISKSEERNSPKDDVLMKNELPRERTSSVGSGFCVSDSAGFVMSSEASIESLQPFSLGLHVPYSIIRGETLTLKVHVLNYLASSIPVNVSIKANDAFELVTPPIVANCIEARDTQVVEFKIRPIALGRLNITINGYVDAYSRELCHTGQLPYGEDELVKSLMIESEGLPTEITRTRFVCPQDFHNDRNISMESQLPYEHVNGSERVSVSVVGDLMGSVLDSLETLLQTPVGCGENNMLTFTSLLSVAAYLEASKQLDDNLKKKIVSHLQKGYQVELNCRHKDGSFSTFGPRDDDGSVWHTAFVAKSFAKARKFIYVDNKVLEESIRWIVNQQSEDGCFDARETMLHKDFNPALSFLGEEEKRTLRTAFALVSLLESQWRIDDVVIANATLCLKRQQNMDPYTQALTAYALALTNDKDARDHLERLLKQALKGDSSMWWVISLTDGGFSIPTNIEITSYALLALLQFKTETDMATARHVVRWLSEERNSRWIFTTTQDTPIGIQALAAYATALGVKDVDLNVTIVAEKVNVTIPVRNENRLAGKQVQLPVIPTEIQIEVKGTGCAVVQTAYFGNLNLTFEDLAFAVNVSSEPVGEESTCVPRRLNVCAKYLLPGLTTMTVMEIDMVSGYAVERQEMRSLLQQNPKIKRAEKRQNKVALYFDFMDEKDYCVNFIVWPAFEVQDALPAYIKVADYYEHTRYGIHTYRLPPPCGLATSPMQNIAA